MGYEQVEAIESAIAARRDNAVASAMDAAGLNKVADATKRAQIASDLSTSSVEKLTKAKIRSALASADLTDEQREQITSTLLNTNANRGLSISFETLKVNALAAISAMMTNPLTWVSIGINLISGLVNAWQDAKQKAEEARQAMSDAAEEAAEQRKSLSALIDEYKTLASAGDFDSSARTRAKETQDEITKLVGKQAENLDLVNGKIDEEIRKLNDVAVRQAHNNRNALDTKLRDAQNRYNDGYGVEGSAVNYAGNDPRAVDIYNSLKKIGVTDGEIVKFTTDLGLYNANAEEALDAYRRIQDALLSDDSWQELWSEDRAQDILNHIQSQIEVYEGVINEFQEAQKNYLENEAVIDLGEYVKSNDINSSDSFNAFVDAVKESKEYSDEYKGILIDLATKTFPEYAKAAGMIEASTDEAGEELQSFTSKLSDLPDAISQIRDLADPLKTAMEEMMSGGGLSSGTAQTIIEKLTEAGLDYVDYLYEENGALKLNTTAWADYIRTVNTANLEGVSEEQAGVLRELYATLTEELAGELYDEAISKLDDLHEALDGLSDVDTLDIETFEKLRELMPDLIGNVHDVESAQAALIRAIERGEQEAEAAYGAMLYANQSWVSGTINSSVGLSNALVTYYGKDVENWKANAASKWEVDSNLVQNLSELWSKYYGVSTQELERELQQVESQIDMANRSLQRNVKGGGKSASSIEAHELQEQYDELAAVLEMRKSAEKAFQELLNTSYNGSGVSSSGSGGGSSKEVEEYIADIEKFREATEALRKAQEEAERLQNEAKTQAGDGEKIEFQKRLVDAYRDEQIAIQHLNAVRATYISESVDSLRKLGFAVDYNAETNELWVENMEHLNELTATSKGEYDSLQEATNALRQETEDLIETLTNLNEENRNGASTWLELRRQAVDCFLSIVDTAHEAVDEIQDVSDVLHQAADEFAANDGFITIDTWQSILKLGPQYLQLLKDENGLWEINEERVNAVIAAKSRQLAVENAMSYVQQLKVAAWAGEIDKLNELIFVNDSATSSTWGLVYAELELMRVMGELDDSQYAAALHNIQAMEDLAENAISHIGFETDSVAKGMESMRDQLEKTKDGLQDMLDELEDMQDGAGDLIDYVMDMLKDCIEQQIDLIEAQKDAYSELIDLKKESLDASKDEQDYQKEISKKLKEMAALQERINSLALDDSRSAQAERAGLLEEMAELQEDLADAQTDKAIEAQKAALDKMEEDYHTEKDREIEALEESISSTQKLYDMAISYIRDHWGTLYSELIGWNTEYGSNLNSEITEAWEAACSAAERYGDFVSAVMGGISSDIDRITSQIEALDTKISNLGSGNSGGGGSLGGSLNTTVSNNGMNSRQTNEDMVRSIVARMKDLGAQWSSMNGTDSNDDLHKQAEKLAAQLDQYGVHAEYHPVDGTWWITRDELDPNNVGKRLHSCYHTGGFVGKEPLKPNERYIKAENGELMMTARQQDSLAEQINRIEVMTKAFRMAMVPTTKLSSGGAPSNTAQRIINSVTNNSRPVNNISINGPTISCVPEKSVESHIKVTRDMMNQIGNLLRRGI